MSRAKRYVELFARHRSATIRELWPWQDEVLAAYQGVTGDAAVELPTGTGKTLIALLVGEEFRAATDRLVAYLAGNKQLAQQIERQARKHGFPVVRFQGSKHTWNRWTVRNPRGTSDRAGVLTDYLGSRFTQGVKLPVSRLAAICGVRE